MPFQIAEHFLNPLSAGVGAQNHLPVRKVRDQTSGLIFSNFPMHKQVHRINLGLRQPSLLQPHTLARLFNPTIKNKPFHLPIKAYVCPTLFGAKCHPNAIYPTVAALSSLQIRYHQPTKRQFLWAKGFSHTPTKPIELPVCCVL